MPDLNAFSVFAPEPRLLGEPPPAAAAEFPNDNPRLHRGARWLCLQARGPARAVWRWSPQGALAAPAADVTALAPCSAAPSALRAEPSEPALPRVMDIDPERVVLRQRVEDVPPPPEFVYKPFRRSTPALAPATPAVFGTVVVRRVIGIGPMPREVRRNRRVDIAPCIAIGAAPPAPLFENVGQAEASLPVVEPAAFAPAATALAPLPVAVEAPPRRAPRRGRLRSVMHSDELRQAILDLESAFGERVSAAAAP